MAQEQDTQHALLIPWGHFAREIGLISGIEAVKLHQKVCEHTPQAKVIEFLVAIFSGAKYLQDISHAGHPLDKDPAVAHAWGQANWADYTGISRTLKQLSWAEVRAHRSRSGSCVPARPGDRLAWVTGTARAARWSSSEKVR